MLLRSRRCVFVLAICAVLAGGCIDRPTFVDNGQLPPDAGRIDAPPVPDANIAGFDCGDWNPAHFTACLVQDPGPGLTLIVPGEYRYNTDTGLLTNPNDGMVVHAHQDFPVESGVVRFARVGSFELGAQSTLRVVGSKPLLIGSWTTISVAGVIDVSSYDGDDIGAGARACGVDDGNANSDGDGGGGGGGGFGSPGGDGGSSDDDKVRGGGGSGVVSLSPAAILGGCHGGEGGARIGGVARGHGGGAIQLTAYETIEIVGTIRANGEGGDASDLSTRSGGGGGGSGGFIGLDAQASLTLASTARLLANGGGGGQGAGGVFGLAEGGDNGTDSTEPASGGDRSGAGGDGGDGGSASSPSGADGRNGGSSGGGGGGGGVGYISSFNSQAMSNPGSVASPGIQHRP